MVSPSTIRNKTGRKRICCRFLCVYAHVEQERRELCRIGNCESFLKSDNGCYSQRRRANKRRSDRACQRIRFIRDSKASRMYSGRSVTRKTQDHGYSHEWSTGQKPQLIKDGRRIKCTANYIPIVVPGLSTSSSSSATPTSPTSVLQEAEHPASTRCESSSSTAWVSPSHEPREIEKYKNGDNENVRGNPLLDLPKWLE